MKVLPIIFSLIIPLNIFGQELFRLIERNEYEIVTNWSDAVNMRDENEATALMWAAYTSDLKMVKILIDKGANPNAKGWIIWQDSVTGIQYIYGSLLAIAVGEKKNELLHYLIEKQAIPVDDKEVNLYDGTESGWTGLHWAAATDNLAAAKYLIGKGATVNIQANAAKGKTPLMFAVINQKESLFYLLMESGADPAIADITGKTALDYAFEAKNSKFVKYLIENGATISGKAHEDILDKLKQHFGVNSVDEL